MYNVVQRTCTEHVRKYLRTVHVLYTRTRTVQLLRNFFLRNFFFKQLLLYSTRTVQRTRTVPVQYEGTCSLRVQLYTYNKAMLYAVQPGVITFNSK